MTPVEQYAQVINNQHAEHQATKALRIFNMRPPFASQEEEAEAIMARVAVWELNNKEARALKKDASMKLSMMIAEGRKAATFLRASRV
jgi:hypothetical protein